MRPIRTFVLTCLATVALCAFAGSTHAVTIYEKNFDSNLDLWTRGDANPANGLDYWGLTDCYYVTGKSAWCARLNHENSDQCTHYYNSADAYLISPAIDLSNHTGVHVEFDWKLELSGDGDYFAVYVSPDGSNWNERILYRTQTVGSFYWQTDFGYTVPATWTTLYVKFRFVTNGSNWNYKGACVDNLLVTGTYNPPVILVDCPGDLGVWEQYYCDTFEATVENEGGRPLVLTGVSTPAYAQPQFTLPLSVAPGGWVDLPFRFCPATVGNYSQTISISSNAPAAPVVICPVTACIEPADVFSASPSSMDFGTLYDGESRDRSVAITYQGCDPVTITALDLPTGITRLAPSFPLTLSMGQSFNLACRIMLQEEGAVDDDVCLLGGAHALECVRVIANVQPCHQPLTANPTTVDFGSVNTGACSPARSVTITSHSCRSVDLIVETPDGILEAGGVYSFTLAAGASRTLSFQYCPDYEETLDDMIVVRGDLLPEDLEVPIRGTATECHQPLTSNPTGIDFGTVNIGVCSPARSVTITSNSCANVTVTNIVRPDGVLFDGTPPPSSFVMAPGASRTFSVKYCPDAEDILDDVIVVEATELEDNLEIPVHGEGLPCDPELAINPEDLDFGVVTVGLSATRYAILSNTAACGNLVITSVTGSSSDFQPTYATPRTILPGRTDTLRITFTPPTEEYYYEEIEIVSNDPNSPHTIYVEGEGGCARGITVTSPNGGETWPVGSTQLISWTSTCLTGNVNIYLNRDYPFGTWESLLSNTANDGIQSWTVSGSASTSARIRVMSAGTPVVGDTSNANFMISTAPPATITAVQPNGGEQLTVGVPYTILWQSSGVSGNVNIDWKTNYPSGSWVPLFTNTPNDGSQSWTPTSTASAARIRIRSASNSAVGDTSAANFTVVQPRPITITQPNGGETLQPGQNYNITWTSTLSPTARVQIAIKYNFPAGNWAALVVNTLNDGVWNWTVPSVPQTCQARVRILNMANSTQGDTSDATFCTGVAGSSITVTQPNGGESWALNSVQSITWNAVNMPGNVRVQLNRSYPSTAWEDLAENTVNDGNHSWTVTGTASVTCRVRVLDEATQSIGDTSNANLSIGAAGGPNIRVLTPNGGETLVIRQPYNITWTSSGISGNVTIQVNNYYPGNSWANITTSTANDGSFSWTPLGPTTSSARIRIISVNSPTIGDTSNASFSIQAAAGNLPGGGGQIAGASPDDLIPTEFYLANNYPNPFNASTMIEFGVPRDQYVVVSIYDVLGRQQVILFKGVAEAGVHKVTWNAVSAPTGIYFVTLAGDGISVAPRKMVYLK